MAQLPVIVMCRSERPPPDPICSLAFSATKSPTTQKAAYVSGHISCEFTETVFIKSLTWIAWRLDESRHWYIAVFGVLHKSLHIKFSF